MWDAGLHAHFLGVLASGANRSRLTLIFAQNGISFAQGEIERLADSIAKVRV
jgi:hypothetical protein